MDFQIVFYLLTRTYLNCCKYSFVCIELHVQYLALNNENTKCAYWTAHVQLYMQVKYMYLEISVTCFILFARVHMQLYSKEKASKLDKVFYQNKSYCALTRV